MAHKPHSNMPLSLNIMYSKSHIHVSIWRRHSYKVFNPWVLYYSLLKTKMVADVTEVVSAYYGPKCLSQRHHSNLSYSEDVTDPVLK